MSVHYTTSDFFLMLKLDLFKKGEVDGWGDVSLSDSNNTLLLRKGIEVYKNQQIPQRQLALGLYLLDFYLFNKYSSGHSDYIAIVASCKTNLYNKNKIYVLKLSNVQNIVNIQNSVVNAEPSRRRRSLFRRKSNRPTFDASPLNSVPRKH